MPVSHVTLGKLFDLSVLNASPEKNSDNHFTHFKVKKIHLLEKKGGSGDGILFPFLAVPFLTKNEFNYLSAPFLSFSGITWVVGSKNIRVVKIVFFFSTTFSRGLVLPKECTIESPIHHIGHSTLRQVLK